MQQALNITSGIISSFTPPIGGTPLIVCYSNGISQTLSVLFKDIYLAQMMFTHHLSFRIIQNLSLTKQEPITIRNKKRLWTETIYIQVKLPLHST